MKRNGQLSRRARLISGWVRDQTRCPTALGAFNQTSVHASSLMRTECAVPADTGIAKGLLIELSAGEAAQILDVHRSQDGSHDVLVPGSGGKDSAFVAHQLKTRWGMHPLSVTWSPFAYTEIGHQNLQAFIHSGFDNILATPNGLLHRKLTMLSTALVGDPFLPFIWGQISYVFHLAKALDIPLVFFGENGEAEYGGSTDTEDLMGMPTEAWADNYWKGVTPTKLIEAGSELGVISTEEAEGISRFYFPPDLHSGLRPLENYWFGYFTRIGVHRTTTFIAQKTQVFGLIRRGAAYLPSPNTQALTIASTASIITLVSLSLV